MSGHATQPAERSPRPLSVIQSDVAVTETGLNACRQVVEALLAERYILLSEGWPTTHPMCEALDRDAERWAAQAEHQRRALLELRSELDGPWPASSPVSGMPETVEGEQP